MKITFYHPGLDGRKSILKEIYESTDNVLKEFLRKEFMSLSGDINFISSLPGHLAPYSSFANERADKIKQLIHEICNKTKIE